MMRISTSSTLASRLRLSPFNSSEKAWPPERIAHVGSNALIVFGTNVALGFAINAVKGFSLEYVAITLIVVGGTLAGGGCLLALVNVAWMSRRVGKRVSFLQIVCNILLLLIMLYLEAIFFDRPKLAVLIAIGVGLPMFIMVNLPSCFVKKIVTRDGHTVCEFDDDNELSTVAGHIQVVEVQSVDGKASEDDNKAPEDSKAGEDGTPAMEEP